MNEAIRDSIPVGKLGLGFLPQSCAHRALQVSRVSGSSLTGVYSSVFAITYLLAYPDGPIGPKSCRQARVELHDDQRLGLQRVGCRWVRCSTMVFTRPLSTRLRRGEDFRMP